MASGEGDAGDGEAGATVLGGVNEGGPDEADPVGTTGAQPLANKATTSSDAARRGKARDQPARGARCDARRGRPTGS